MGINNLHLEHFFPYNKTTTNHINVLHVTFLLIQQFVEPQLYMININQQPLKISLFHFLMQHFHHIQLQLPHFLPPHFTRIGFLHHKLHLCISEHWAATYLHSHLQHNFRMVLETQQWQNVLPDLVLLSTEDFLSSVKAATLRQTIN